MNDQLNTLPVGTPVSFHADFRQWEGHIDSYTPTGRAVIVTEEGRQFTLEPNHLAVIRRLASRITPADEGILAAKQDAAPLELDETVYVNLTDRPAVIVKLNDDQTVNVAFVGTYEAHTVPVSSVTRRPITGDETPLQTLAKIIAQRDAQIRDMERQIASAAHERDVLRYGLNQIVNYKGSRYTDDAEVMKEIAEAALDGETITPRK